MLPWERRAALSARPCTRPRRSWRGGRDSSASAKGRAVAWPGGGWRGAVAWRGGGVGVAGCGDRRIRTCRANTSRHTKSACLFTRSASSLCAARWMSPALPEQHPPRRWRAAPTCAPPETPPARRVRTCHPHGATTGRRCLRHSPAGVAHAAARRQPRAARGCSWGRRRGQGPLKLLSRPHASKSRRSCASRSPGASPPPRSLMLTCTRSFSVRSPPGGSTSATPAGGLAEHTVAVLREGWRWSAQAFPLIDVGALSHLASC
jgi:hypothetical protein